MKRTCYNINWKSETLRPQRNCWYDTWTLSKCTKRKYDVQAMCKHNLFSLLWNCHDCTVMTVTSRDSSAMMSLQSGGLYWHLCWELPYFAIVTSLQQDTQASIPHIICGLISTKQAGVGQEKKMLCCPQQPTLCQKLKEKCSWESTQFLFKLGVFWEKMVEDAHIFVLPALAGKTLMDRFVPCCLLLMLLLSVVCCCENRLTVDSTFHMLWWISTKVWS